MPCENCAKLKAERDSLAERLEKARDTIRMCADFALQGIHESNSRSYCRAIRDKALEFLSAPPSAPATTIRPLTFDRFQKANAERCVEFKHTTGAWSLLEWAGAAAGEMGEVANVCKKIRRREQGIGGKWGAKDPDMATLRANLAEEIGDVLAYLALLAEAAGLNLGMCAAVKFDRVSDKIEWNGERLLASLKKGE